MCIPKQGFWPILSNCVFGYQYTVSECTTYSPQAKCGPPTLIEMVFVLMYTKDIFAYSQTLKIFKKIGPT